MDHLVNINQQDWWCKHKGRLKCNTKQLVALLLIIIGKRCPEFTANFLFAYSVSVFESCSMYSNSQIKKNMI